MAEMVVAEKLGKTLTELREGMTVEELWLWHSFYTLRQEEEEAANRRAMRRR